jgi:hypothetical protein
MKLTGDPQWSIPVRAMSASSTPSPPNRAHTAAVADVGASPLGLIDETIDEQLHLAEYINAKASPWRESLPLAQEAHRQPTLFGVFEQM